MRYIPESHAFKMAAIYVVDIQLDPAEEGQKTLGSLYDFEPLATVLALLQPHHFSMVRSVDIRVSSTATDEDFAHLFRSIARFENLDYLRIQPEHSFIMRATIILIEHAAFIRSERLHLQNFDVNGHESDLIKALAHIKFLSIDLPTLRHSDPWDVPNIDIKAINAARKENPSLLISVTWGGCLENNICLLASPPIFGNFSRYGAEICVIASMLPHERATILNYCESVIKESVMRLPLNTGNGIPPALVLHMTKENPRFAIHFFKSMPSLVAATRSEEGDTFLHVLARSKWKLDDRSEEYLDALLSRSQARM